MEVHLIKHILKKGVWTISNHLTIVGPEPSGSEGKTGQRKVNIEALLLMAKYNTDFRKKLFQHRDIAIKESGIGFSDGEIKLITSINTPLLKQYINNFTVKGITKRSLKGWACAASIVMLLSTLLIKCGDSPSESGSDDDIITDGTIPDYSYIEYLNLPNDKKDIEDIFPTSNSSEKSKE